MKGPVRDFDYGIGVDLSATNTRVLLGGSGGNVIAERRERTLKDSPESPARQIIGLAKYCIEAASIGWKAIDGIGVSCVGPYDQDRGGISGTPNIGFKFIPLRDPIKEAFPGKRFVRGGDCFGAVHAEADYGLGRGKDNIVYVTISTGIGGGVIADGRALSGRDGDAAHIGHFTIDPSPNARLCGCGRKGHWEAYCSGRAVTAILRESLASGYVNLVDHDDGTYGFSWLDVNEVISAAADRLGKEQDDVDIEDLMVEDLYRGARKETDSHAKWLIEDINKLNALGFSMVTDAYNPEIIIVGGSMMNDSDLILPYVREHVPEHAILEPPEIAKTTLGAKNVALGGLAMLRHYDGE